MRLHDYSAGWSKAHRTPLPGWRVIGWEGRAVYALLVPLLGRTGSLPLEGMSPEVAVSAAIETPSEVVAVGLRRLLDAGSLVVVDGCLVDPYHAEKATPTSNAARQRDKRARTTEPTRSVTPETRGVTKRHAVTRSDTKEKEKEKEIPLPSPSGTPPPDPETSSRNPPVEADRSAAAAPRVLTEQQLRVKAVEDFFAEADEEAPKPGVIVGWFKLFDEAGLARGALRVDLEEARGKGILGKGSQYLWGYLRRRVQDGEAGKAAPPPRRNGNGSAPFPKAVYCSREEAEKMRREMIEALPPKERAELEEASRLYRERLAAGAVH